MSRLTAFQAQVSSGLRSGLLAGWSMTRPMSVGGLDGVSGSVITVDLKEL